MRKILFVCNTYFQLITAINISLTTLKDENKDILLTDTSNGLLSLKENIQKSKVFSNVYTFERKKAIQNNNKFKDMVLFIVGKYTFQIPIPYDYYTEIMFYNFDLLIYNILESYNKKGKKLIINRFEEGYISYYYGNIDSRIIRFGDSVRKLWKRDLKYLSVINEYYFYEPEFVQFLGSYKLKKIPKVLKGKSEIKTILNNIFEIKEEDFKIKEKYIFFEESFSLNKNTEINDLMLIKQIADIVGKDNFIVKLHPRTEKNRFENLGIKTYHNPFPWELLQLNESFEEKCFLTISSGSVLQSRILFGENIKTVLLFNCIPHKPKLVNQKYFKHIENIANKYKGQYIIPNNINEIMD